MVKTVVKKTLAKKKVVKKVPAKKKIKEKPVSVKAKQPKLEKHSKTPKAPTKSLLKNKLLPLKEHKKENIKLNDSIEKTSHVSIKKEQKSKEVLVSDLKEKNLKKLKTGIERERTLDTKSLSKGDKEFKDNKLKQSEVVTTKTVVTEVRAVPKKNIDGENQEKKTIVRKDHPLDQILQKQMKKNPPAKKLVEHEQEDTIFIQKPSKAEKSQQSTKGKQDSLKKENMALSKKKQSLSEDDEGDEDFLDKDLEDDHDGNYDDEEESEKKGKRKSEEDEDDDDDDFREKGRGRDAALDFEEISEGSDSHEDTDDEDEDAISESMMLLKAKEIGAKIFEEITNLTEDYNLADIREAIKAIDFFSGNENDECVEKYCENLQTTMNYCRFHYIKNWKLIKKKQLILGEGKLQQYIEELIQKYPPKYIEIIMNDLTTDKQFYRILKDLNIDTLFQYDDNSADLEGDEDIVVEARTFTGSRNFDDEEII